MTSTLALRPYQLDGIEAVRHRIRDGKKRIVFVLATGGGKTVVATGIIANALERGKRVLAVAHRIELLKQMFCKLVRGGIDPRQIGIIKAGIEGRLVDAVAPDPSRLDDDELWRLWARRRPVAPVQVASIDSIRNRNKPPADLVIVDECHRSLAKSYKDLVAAYPNAVVLGLTATPYRADNRGLGELFEDLIVIASPKLLVSEGWLVEPVVWSVPASSRPDLSNVRVRGGDYDERELAVAADQVELVGDIVEHWQRRAEGRRTVVFAASVAHSKHIAERFVAAGIPAEHVDGETPAERRAAILGRLARGETLVLSNVGVCTEGWDCPSVKCCVLARPTKSTGLFLQMAGRILRPWTPPCSEHDDCRALPEMARACADARGAPSLGAIILDHAGCVAGGEGHGFPTEDREFSLEGKKKRPGASTAPAKECPQCFAVLAPAVRVCPGCGFEFSFEPSEAVPEEAAGELVRVGPDDLARRRWDALLALWHRKNATRAKPLAEGWCWVQYQKRYKAKPPSWCRNPKLTPEQKWRRAEAEHAERASAPKSEVDVWSSVLELPQEARP